LLSKGASCVAPSLSQARAIHVAAKARPVATTPAIQVSSVRQVSFVKARDAAPAAAQARTAAQAIPAPAVASAKQASASYAGEMVSAAVQIKRVMRAMPATTAKTCVIPAAAEATPAVPATFVTPGCRVRATTAFRDSPSSRSTATFAKASILPMLPFRCRP
jgi:hypothetical protein